jgi:anti-sigma B factor antagonist
VIDFEGREPNGHLADSGRFELVVEADRQGVCIRIIGELDLATVPELERALNDLPNQRPDRVLIDLCGVQFMDSTGLATLIRAHQCADAGGYRLALRHGQAQVRRLLEVTGTLDRLPFED